VSMHIHVRVHHWVLWWFYLGVICGGVAIINILGRNLTPTQTKVILVLGAFHWLLGGLVCYAVEGVRIAPPPQLPKDTDRSPASQQTEWHSASEFLLPGSRKSILPPRY
jgi:hypothetical protein